MKTTGNANPILKQTKREGDYIQLEDGLWLKDYRDGRAIDEITQNAWQMVSEIINPDEEEYNFLGWQLA